jgi:hypothetical protein
MSDSAIGSHFDSQQQAMWLTLTFQIATTMSQPLASVPITAVS